jgi:hypothetical protein
MAATMTQFRLQPCQRCQRDTIQALRNDHRICSACEPAAFERVAVEAGRRELLG